MNVQAIAERYEAAVAQVWSLQVWNTYGQTAEAKAEHRAKCMHADAELIAAQAAYDKCTRELASKL